MIKIHLIKKQAIADFSSKHARSSKSFQIWLAILRNADWEKPSDIFLTFESADLLGNGGNRVTFNIGGNEYRMLYKYQVTSTEIRLYTKWTGTHNEYNLLCKLNMQYKIDQYSK